jgi:hypothetical protein
MFQVRHISTILLPYKRALITAGLWLRHGWDICPSSKFIMIPPQARVLDGSKYQWKQSQDDPGLWQREALAVENLWPFSPREVRELLLRGDHLLFKPIEVTHTFSAAQDDWKELRILHPEIVLTAHVQSDGKRLLEFHIPQSEHGIDGASFKETSSIELHKTIAQRKPGADDSALLCLQAKIAGSKRDVAKIRFLFYVEHYILMALAFVLLPLSSSAYLLGYIPQEVMRERQTSNGRIARASYLHLGLAL